MSLTKKVNLFHAVSLIVGSVLGSGLVILPGLAYQKAGVASLLSWVAMSLLIIPFVYILTKISKSHPSAGGIVTFIHNICGTTVGVSINFLSILSIIFLVPVVSIIASNYISVLGDFTFGEKLIISLCLLIFSTILNVYKIDFLLKVQGIGTIILFSLLVVLIFSSFGTSYENVLFELHNDQSFCVQNVWFGMTIIFWAYLGWENLSFITEEFINIEKYLIPASVVSFFIMVFLYLGLSIAVIGLLDPSDKMTALAPLAQLSLIKFGSLGGVGFVLIICLIMILNVNAWVWGPSRLVYAAGRKGIVFKKLGIVNHKGVPANSLFFLLCCYCLVFLWMFIFNKHNIESMIIQINANFIFLYILTVISFIKYYTGFIDRSIGVISLFITCYFFTKFDQYAIYTILLFIFFSTLNKIVLKNGVAKNTETFNCQKLIKAESCLQNEGDPLKGS